MKIWEKGFTVVELVVVIAIIGILTTIGVFGYNTIQNDARDSKRGTQAQLIAESLEKLFSTNGEYPGCSLLTGSASAVTSNVLSGIEQSALTAPLDETGVNSISCDINDLNDTSVDKFVFVPNDDSSICTSGTACQSWVIRYRQSDGNIAEIESRGQTVASSAMMPVLTVTDSSINSISLSWTSIAGATGYSLRISPNPNMSDHSTVTIAAGTTTRNVTGLNSATNYYFTVFPVVPAGNGEWSTVARGSTLVESPGAPTITATISGNNAIGQSPVISCTNSTAEYQFRSRQSSSSDTPGSWSSWSEWSTDRTISVPASHGWTYGFQAQVRCVANALSSDSVVSNIASITRPIPTPTAPALTAAISGTNAVGTVAAATCSAGTTAQYRFHNRGSATSTLPAWSAWTAWGTSRTNSVAANRGWRHYFEAQVRCVVGTESSGAATTNTSYTMLALVAPSVPSLSNSGYDADIGTVTWTRGNASCPTGANASYQLDFSNNGGASGSYSWTTVSATTKSESVTYGSGIAYTMKLRARCATSFSTSPWSSERSSAYTSVINTPASRTVTAAISGTNAVGTSTAASCPAGTTAQYRFQNRNSYTATMPAWSTTWTAWGTSRTNSVAANQGYKYEFRSQARCVRGSINSSASTSNTGSTIRSITAPANPTISNSTSGNNTTWTWSSVSCPANTTRRNEVSFSNNGGLTGGFGFSYTSVLSTARSTVTQGINYTMAVRTNCSTVHTTSSWSSPNRSSTYARPVAAPTNFTNSYKRVSARQIGITGSATCSGGTTLETRGDVWVSGWNWRPPVGPASGTAQGWTSAYNGGSWWWHDYYTGPLEAGAVSSSNIPTTSKWMARFQFRCYQHRTSVRGPASSTYQTQQYNF